MADLTPNRRAGLVARDERRSVSDGPAPYGAPGHSSGPAAVSVRVYGSLIQAFNCFNYALFNGELPAPVITLQRKRGAGGYFHGYRFVERQGEDVLHEIALNPAGFATLDDRSILAILAILVHEMVHEWQQVAGTPPRSIVHDREWADKMIAIGLMPTHTGRPNGRQVGRRMSHMIIEGGAFDQVCRALLETGLSIPVEERFESDMEAASRRRKSASKTAYSCVSCGLKAWAKPRALLECGACGCPMYSNTPEI